MLDYIYTPYKSPCFIGNRIIVTETRGFLTYNMRKPLCILE